MNLLFALSGVFISGAAVFALITGEAAYALTFHIIGALLCGYVATKWQSKNLEKPNVWFEYVISIMVFGFGGLLVLMHAVGQRFNHSEGTVNDYAEYIDAELRLGDLSFPSTYSSVAPNPESLAPLSDILRSNASDDQKRTAIEFLARLETPAAVATLREALTHASTEVRFYAASAISKLEETLAVRLSALEVQFSDSHSTPEDECDLAQVYFDYVYYNLLDEVRKNEYLQSAIIYATSAYEKKQLEQSVLILGRVNMMLKKYEDAEKWFTRYIEKNADKPKGFLWRAESLFYQGRYADTRRDCIKADALGEIPERMCNAVNLWKETS